MRRETFKICTTAAELDQFTAYLKKRRKKYHVTPWSNSDRTETGFVVWYFIR